MLLIEDSYLISVPESKLSSGRDYLIMFMENSVEYPVRSPMVVFVGGLNTESKQKTKVTVSYPLSTGDREIIEMFINPREVHKLELNYTVMQVNFKFLNI